MFKIVLSFFFLSPYFCNPLCHVFKGLQRKNKRPREVRGKAVYEGPTTEIHKNPDGY